MNVFPKKHLGQHFLTDLNIARAIAESLQVAECPKNILEIGPGLGVLTQFLLKIPNIQFKAIELDKDCIPVLNQKFSLPAGSIIEADFLKMNLNDIFEKEFAVIGNFPYNISSQIVFKIIENKQKVPMAAGMFQKEVAERICAKPGSKVYGISSVLTQAFYNAEYLFTVDEHVFNPPPKVKSGVIRLIRKKELDLGVNEKALFTTVKTAFNQRRKTLRNALKSLMKPDFEDTNNILNLRAEQLSVSDFIALTKQLF